MLNIMVIIIVIAYIVRLTKRTYRRNRYNPEQTTFEYNQESTTQNETNNGKKNYIEGYQQKWLLSYNEKAAYKIIKQVAEEKGYTVFAKVRLLDLVEPKIENRKDQSYLWKIQAKHVDFVICDEKMVARWIIELQDSSHAKENRIERDNLVKAILTNCKYKILMTYAANKEEIEKFLNNKPKIQAHNIPDTEELENNTVTK